MVNKRGYLRTVEAVIAVMITFVFLMYFLPQYATTTERAENLNILAKLGKNDDFRGCVAVMNTTCINETIDENLEDKYDFRFNVSENPNAEITGLPLKRVYADSVLIAGNTTNQTTRMVRLFYWAK